MDFAPGGMLSLLATWAAGAGLDTLLPYTRYPAERIADRAAQEKRAGHLTGRPVQKVISVLLPTPLRRVHQGITVKPIPDEEPLPAMPQAVIHQE
jgi:hypothetical protein